MKKNQLQFQKEGMDQTTNTTTIERCLASCTAILERIGSSILKDKASEHSTLNAKAIEHHKNRRGKQEQSVPSNSQDEETAM